MLLLMAVAAFMACDDTPTTQRLLAPAPATMDIVSGNSQSAPAGTSLTNPIVVRVRDDGGAPVSNQVVNFKVTAGGGTVFAGTSLTNSDGVAQEHWTLGPTAGTPQTVEARAVDGSDGSKQVFATFTATATDPTSTVASVSVSPASSNLVVGGTQQLTATAKNADGDPLSGRTFTWSSSNTNVATVSSAGLVTARASGNATISATTGGRTGSATVAVTTATATDTIPPGTPGTPTITTTAVNADTFSVAVTWAAATDAAKYSWTTGSNSGGFNTQGETVNRNATFRAPALSNANGYWFCVSAVDAAGNSSEDSACNGYAAPAGSSTPTVATVSISPASASLAVGATQQLSASARDASGTAISGKTFTWSSSNTTVATVNSSGLVTARADGTATITASVDGKSGTASVTVTAAPPPPGSTVATVSITPASASLTVGGTRQLAATAKDASGNTITGKTFTWSSSSTTVATVNSSGLVTARTAGTATITASVDGKSGTSAITVQAATVAGVSVSPASASLTVGGTRQLSATATDASGNTISGKTFTWSSSNTGVATVNSSGLVTARAAGNATITATVDGESGTSSISVTTSTGGVAPNVLEDFSTYTSTSNLISDPRGIYDRVEDFSTSRIILDTSVGFGGSDRSMRYDWGGGASTISRMLEVPNVKEIWVEWTHRFENGYSAEWGGGGDAAYKFLHIEIDADRTGGGRFGHGFRFGDNGASNIEPPNDAYEEGFAETNFSLASVADGQWHTYRYHVRLGSPDLHEFWVDGVLKARESSFNTNASLIWGVALGRNQNQTPTSLQRQWWGQIKLWWGSNNPGW